VKRSAILALAALPAASADMLPAGSVVGVRLAKPLVLPRR